MYYGSVKAGEGRLSTLVLLLAGDKIQYCGFDIHVVLLVSMT